MSNWTKIGSVLEALRGHLSLPKTLLGRNSAKFSVACVSRPSLLVLQVDDLRPIHTGSAEPRRRHLCSRPVDDFGGNYVWDDSGMVNDSETVSRDIDIAVVFGLAWFRGMARAPGLVWRVGQRG